jgi:hypothetical protein
MEGNAGNHRSLLNIKRERNAAKIQAGINAKRSRANSNNVSLLNNARMASNNSQSAAQLRRAEAQLSHLNRQPTESELAAELRKVQRFNSMMMSQTRKGGRKSRKNRKTRRN